MSKCVRPGCLKVGKNMCSICLREPYCGSECQKIDWKSHKLICKTLKKISHQFQPYNEVLDLIDLLREKNYEKKELTVRVLVHLLSYVNFQFGDRVTGRSYHENCYGETINNWAVEIQILIPIYDDLIIAYQSDESLSKTVNEDLSFPCYEKILNLLRPWSTNLDLNSTSPVDDLGKGEVSHLLMVLSKMECRIARLHIRRASRQMLPFNLGEDHLKLSLSYARRFEGDEIMKADLLCGALTLYSNLRAMEENYADASTFAEEAYNVAVTAYDPVHPEVQEAASTLIECYLHKGGDLTDAETYADLTLHGLKDPKNGLDQESEEVARGYFNFASVIFSLNVDLVKAETLARESFRIRVQLHGGVSDVELASSAGLLGDILKTQGKLGNETKELFERALAIYTDFFGPNMVNRAVTNARLGSYYYMLAHTQQIAETKKENLHLSISFYKESLRFYETWFGLDNSYAIEYKKMLSIVSKKLAEA